jgi:hypothetical protein
MYNYEGHKSYCHSVLGFPVSMSSEFGQGKVDFQTLVVHGLNSYFQMVSKCSISHDKFYTSFVQSCEIEHFETI